MVDGRVSFLSNSINYYNITHHSGRLSSSHDVLLLPVPKRRFKFVAAESLSRLVEPRPELLDLERSKRPGDAPVRSLLNAVPPSPSPPRQLVDRIAENAQFFFGYIQWPMEEENLHPN